MGPRQGGYACLCVSCNETVYSLQRRKSLNMNGRDVEFALFTHHVHGADHVKCRAEARTIRHLPHTLNFSSSGRTPRLSSVSMQDSARHVYGIPIRIVSIIQDSFFLHGATAQTDLTYRRAKSPKTQTLTGFMPPPRGVDEGVVRGVRRGVRRGISSCTVTLIPAPSSPSLSELVS